MHPQLKATSMNPALTQRGKPMRRKETTREIMHSESRQRIESIRANNSIEQVIARYIELHQSGRRLVAHCPFHHDPTPRFVVYINTQSWFCFSRDLGGDVFKFVELIEKIPFREALEKLGSGAITAQPIPHAPTAQLESVPTLELTEEHFTLLTAATEVYHEAIFARGAVLEYLARRRIDLDLIRHHRIGYASSDDLARYLRFRGWSHDLTEDDEPRSRTIPERRERARDPDVASDLGLVGPRGEYFRQRIVMPELRDGRAIYLVGRATQRYQEAKYLGLPGAPKPLYGIESIRGADDVFVCVGAMDWLTRFEWGYCAVALLGSHLRPKLVNELRDAKRIFIVTDSDEPGRRSARRLAETLGERARIVPPLPSAKDVNELATRPRGREIFAALIEQAR